MQAIVVLFYVFCQDVGLNSIPTTQDDEESLACNSYIVLNVSIIILLLRDNGETYFG